MNTVTYEQREIFCAKVRKAFLAASDKYITTLTVEDKQELIKEKRMIDSKLSDEDYFRAYFHKTKWASVKLAYPIHYRKYRVIEECGFLPNNVKKWYKFTNELV